MEVVVETNAILTGYLPEVDLVHAVAAGIDRARAENDSVLVCCDPVIGDTETGRYVPDGVAEAVRDELVPRAETTSFLMPRTRCF